MNNNKVYMIRLLNQTFPKEICIRINEFIPYPVHPTAKILKLYINKHWCFKSLIAGSHLNEVVDAYDLAEYRNISYELYDLKLYNDMCSDDKDSLNFGMYVNIIIRMYKRGELDWIWILLSS